LVAINAVLTWLTDGRYFFLTYGWQRFTALHWSTWAHIARDIFLPMIGLLLPVVLYLVQEARNPARRLLFIYLAFVLLMSVSASHSGAGSNYFLETVGVLGIVLGLTLHSLSTGRLSGLPIAAVLLIAGAVWMSLFFRNYPRLFNSPPLAEQKLAGDAVLHLMNRIHGPMLSQEPYLVMLAGQPENVIDGYISSFLAPLMKPQRAVLFHDLATGKYRAIVILRNWWEGYLKDEPSIWGELRQGPVLGEHYRELQPQDYPHEELPSYSQYVVLEPCVEHCGVSMTTPLPPEQPRLSFYRSLWNRLRTWLARS
jgi:hypothetical protein